MKRATEATSAECPYVPLVIVLIVPPPPTTILPCFVWRRHLHSKFKPNFSLPVKKWCNDCDRVLPWCRWRIIQFDADARIAHHFQWSSDTWVDFIHSLRCNNNDDGQYHLQCGFCTCRLSQPTDFHTNEFTNTFLPPFRRDTSWLMFEKNWFIKHRASSERAPWSSVLCCRRMRKLLLSTLCYVSYIRIGDTHFYLPPRKCNHWRVKSRRGEYEYF